MTDAQSLCGAIEGGGTKFVCMVGTGPADMREHLRISTTTPENTLCETMAFFRAAEARVGRLEAIGIASFGPVDLRPDSPTFGSITSTPKPGWANVDIVGAVKDALHVPVGFDTDVNAAALAEWRWGAARCSTRSI
jgi:fructokinase